MTRKLGTALLMVVLMATLGVAVTLGVAATLAVASPAPTGQRSVSLIAEPEAGVTPFLKLIAAAHRSIDLTIYELSDSQVEQALAAAARHGVDVKVLLNGGYYGERDSTNGAAYRYLAAHGVHVRYTPTYFALTHQKTLTVDGRESAIMTLNFDGLYSSTRDFAILDSQPADVRAISAVFTADWSGERTPPSSGTGDLVWSPGAATSVLDLIDGARSSIDVESEEMDDAPATDALCHAARRGVDVRIVMTYESDWRSAFDQLSSCGAHVRVYRGQSYYIHAKLLDIDGTRALVSSQNLSASSLTDNRELGIEITAPEVVSALSSDFNSDYAGAAAW
jgi:cardiolipin synthase A/B